MIATFFANLKFQIGFGAPFPAFEICPGHEVRARNHSARRLIWLKAPGPRVVVAGQ